MNEYKPKRAAVTASLNYKSDEELKGITMYNEAVALLCVCGCGRGPHEITF